MRVGGAYAERRQGIDLISVSFDSIRSVVMFGTLGFELDFEVVPSFRDWANIHLFGCNLISESVIFIRFIRV